MISEYLDNELTKEKEAFLFTHLSSCDECREEFKQQNLIQHEVKINQKEVNEKFEQRVFDSIIKREKHKTSTIFTKRVFASVPYAVSIILLIVSIYLFTQSANYLQQLQQVSSKIEEQDKLIKVLFNSIPVDENAINVQKPIIVSTKM
jgi:predicted anti-sigma-YlaC factor YlaD